MLKTEFSSNYSGPPDFRRQGFWRIVLIMLTRDEILAVCRRGLEAVVALIQELLAQMKTPFSSSVFEGTFSLSSGVTVLLSATVVLANLPWWYPRYCNTLREANLASVSRYEYQSATIGTTAKGEFLPVTVPAIPPDDSLAEAILAGQEPDRIDRTFLPPNATYSYLSRDPLATRFSIEAGTSYHLVYKNFYFPGWRVLVDGESVPIQVTLDYGLISFDLHPGKHFVEIRFDPTPLRLFASLISLISFLSLLSLLALTRFSSRRPGRSTLYASHSTLPASHSTLHSSHSTLPAAYLLLPI